MAYERMQDDAPQLTVPTHVPQQSNASFESHKKTIRGWGVVEIILGSLMAILAFATIVIAGSVRAHYHYMFTFVSQGLWGGILLLCNGIWGMKFFSNPTVYHCNCSMALSVISSVVLSAVIALSGFAVATINHWNNLADPLIGLHVSIGILAFAGFIICIVHSVYCCRCVCCTTLPYREIYVTAPQQHQTASHSQNPHFQLMMVPQTNMVIAGHPSAGTQVAIPQVLQSRPGSIVLPQSALVNPQLAYPTPPMSLANANQPAIAVGSAQPIGVQNPSFTIPPVTVPLPPYGN